MPEFERVRGGPTRGATLRAAEHESVALAPLPRKQRKQAPRRRHATPWRDQRESELSNRWTASTLPITTTRSPRRISKSAPGLTESSPPRVTAITCTP